MDGVLGGVAPQRETYLEICASIDREYEAEVAGLLRQLSDGAEQVNGMSLKAISVILTSMIDGGLLNYLISPVCLEPEDAVTAGLVFYRVSATVCRDREYCLVIKLLL